MFCGFAQSENTSKKEIDRKQLRQQKKDTERVEMEKRAMVLKNMLEDHRFVIETELLKTLEGSPEPVDPFRNYIYVDSSRCAIQLSAINTIGGSRMYGSIVVGRMSKYRISESGKKVINYTVDFNASTSTGLLIIKIRVSSNGRATAIVKSASGSGSLTYTGQIVSQDVSNVFKGFPRQ